MRPSPPRLSCFRALLATRADPSLPFPPARPAASKHSLSTGAGVIDADYRGPIFVLLFNHSDVDYEVPRGERVAQLILEKCEYADVAEVEVRLSGGGLARLPSLDWEPCAVACD